MGGQGNISCTQLQVLEACESEFVDRYRAWKLGAATLCTSIAFECVEAFFGCGCLEAVLCPVQVFASLEVMSCRESEVFDAWEK